MGRYASRLHGKLAAKADSLPTEEPERRPGELLPGGIKDIPTLIKEGFDPVHPVYVFMYNMTSRFAEVVSHMPEMKTWARTVEKAEDEYLPSGPPMSPLTGATFGCGLCTTCVSARARTQWCSVRSPPTT